MSVLHQVSLPLLESKWSRYFIVKVKLNRLEDHLALHVDHIAKPINQVASPIDESFTRVEQLTILASHNDVIAKVIYLKVSHDVVQLKVRNLFLGLESLFYLLSLWHLLVLLSHMLNAVITKFGNLIDNFLDQFMSKVIVNLCFILHEHLHVVLRVLVSIYLE